MRKYKTVAVGLAVLAIAFAAYELGRADVQAGVERTIVPTLYAADARTFIGLEAGTVLPQEREVVSSTGTIQERDVYYPGTEALAADEMRVTACGTGMPNARPKQAAACWLVELGNGDKFIFDIGTGSAERISALKIPYDYLDKVFIGHLHSDHFGDLDALWVGGVVGNRVTPLRVWGPSSETPEYGTAYALEHLEESLKWDVDTRFGNTDTRGLFLEVTEFDYRAINEVIYQENGVTIRSIPAIHIYDGPVSFILEWNGLKFAYSSDTYPNKWWIEHTKGVDIAIHEAFITPQALVEKQNFTPAAALNVGTQVHTSPAQFGKVMAEVNPRMAVAYHFFNDWDTSPDVMRDIRRAYAGPLALAIDYMVFNVTRDDIKVRMAVVDEDIWPMPSALGNVPPDPSLLRTQFSEMMLGGRVVHTDILEEIYAEINEMYGTNIPVPK
ncbi:MAG: guanitoxin biosynthesis MBL fold metallo-hydrolase GntH [Planctomycetota bacterium]|jgi:ribonuclease Z